MVRNFRELGGCMITYRNEIWDSLVMFLEILKNYTPFETYENGRYKKRIGAIYDKMLKKCYLRQSDIKLVTDTLMYVNEKDVNGEMTTIMDLGEQYNIECLTTKDGEEIFKKAEKEYNDNKIKAETLRNIQEKEHELEIRKEEHEKFLAEQKRTKEQMDKAKKELMVQKKKLKKINLENQQNDKAEIDKAEQELLNEKNKLKNITLEAVEVEETKETLEEGIKCQI
jgi:hypothetical protein